MPKPTNGDWRPIPGFPAYEVSRDGIVRRIPKPLMGGITNGYKVYNLRRNGKNVTVQAHQAVMWAYVGPQPKGKYVCHGDGIKLNNALKNLRYASAKENMADAFRHGTFSQGERHPCAILTEAAVRHILTSEESSIELAKRYGVLRGTIAAVRSRRNWKGLVNPATKTDFYRRGRGHGDAKLTEKAVRDIRTARLPLKGYAKKYGVTIASIWSAQRRKTWKHVA